MRNRLDLLINLYTSLAINEGDLLCLWEKPTCSTFGFDIM